LKTRAASATQPMTTYLIWACPSNSCTVPGLRPEDDGRGYLAGVTPALGGTTAAGIINTRRVALQLPQYPGGTDAASIRALVLDERNREFFMEAATVTTICFALPFRGERATTRTAFPMGRRRACPCR